ncbi:replication initiation protein (plasmid) [Enterococcus faecium]
MVNQYILFNLRDFVKLKSKYSMILFLELSTFWNTGMYYKRINDLREILGVNPTRNNRDFINNVLKGSVAKF